MAAVRALTPGGRGVDAAIEAVGLPEVWERTVQMVRPGGTVNLFGGAKGGSTFSVSTTLLHYSELTIKGVFHHTPLFRGDRAVAAGLAAWCPPMSLSAANAR